MLVSNSRSSCLSLSSAGIIDVYHLAWAQLYYINPVGFSCLLSVFPLLIEELLWFCATKRIWELAQQENLPSQALVAHACNPVYSGGRDQGIAV
jgi:hypothetical protein